MHRFYMHRLAKAVLKVAYTCRTVLLRLCKETFVVQITTDEDRCIEEWLGSG